MQAVELRLGQWISSLHLMGSRRRTRTARPCGASFSPPTRSLRHRLQKCRLRLRGGSVNFVARIGCVRSARTGTHDRLPWSSVERWTSAMSAGIKSGVNECANCNDITAPESHRSRLPRPGPPPARVPPIISRRVCEDFLVPTMPCDFALDGLVRLGIGDPGFR